MPTNEQRFEATVNGSKPQPTPPNRPNHQGKASEANKQGALKLRDGTKAAMQNVAGFITETRTQRAQAQQAVVSEIRYLLDPDIFLAECLDEAFGGMGKPVDVTELDNPYQGFNLPASRFEPKYLKSAT